MLQQQGLVWCQDMDWGQDICSPESVHRIDNGISLSLPAGPARSSGSPWLLSSSWGTDICLQSHLYNWPGHHFNLGALPPRWQSWEAWHSSLALPQSTYISMFLYACTMGRSTCSLSEISFFMILKTTLFKPITIRSFGNKSQKLKGVHHFLTCSKGAQNFLLALLGEI